MTLERHSNVPRPQAGEVRARWLERMLLPLLQSRSAGEPEQILAYSSERGRPRVVTVVPEVRGTVTIAWKNGNHWLVLRSLSSPTETRWLASFMASVLGVLAFILGCAWLVARAITRPLSRLADAAESARIGQPWSMPADPITPELGKLASALISFDARQRDHVRQQTTMLAGIAHDLGTPLTRLAFRAESLGEPQRLAANADIALMRALIGNSLALARSSMARSEPVDLHPMVHAVVSTSWNEEAPIEVNAAVGIRVEGEPVALQCLVQNLVDNMQRHASGGAIHLWQADGKVMLRVEDNGPGFPEDLLDQLGSPFVRGEPSRNALTGGNGLGLAIARTIAERHGGGLAFGNRDEGGAWVEVTLACAA
ncbi:sensor histidine kinase [Blastomonas natatoria]|uniref:sensor histidine kinase n=1 Tax=Blastomonas natatoria TaxID=34015 RepID=UPI00142D2B8A|nr:ATP-binding protein [Blastomonas natatoria]